MGAAPSRSGSKLSALTAAAAGLLFGVGLGVAGMLQPAKVAGFLDVFGGAWDPTLAFVMGGAVLTYGLAHPVITRRRAPWFDSRFFLPTRRDIDLRLVAGAAIFGLGWGLGGYCPGPALVSLTTLGAPALTFVAAMLAGMVAFRELERR